tara:strand:- start:42 stop:812 length:771 start_codon:yes stop_codon:yes gene_type:complete
MRNVRAKKYLGQHFLTDKKIANNIVDLLHSDANLVVEVGPGMGILTSYLLKKDVDLKLVEIDEESILYLKENYPNTINKIKNMDFLKLDLRKEYKQKFSLIGNFPYNISSQILFKVWENCNQINEVIGMLQKEVAERVVAKKGKKRGIISVLIETFYDSEYCFTVSEDVFNPKPKVKSAVIKLKRNQRKKLDCNLVLFKNLIKLSFNQRRKTLRNALKSFSLENELRSTNLLQKRAEELSVEEFIHITKICQKKQK